MFARMFTLNEIGRINRHGCDGRLTTEFATTPPYLVLVQ